MTTTRDTWKERNRPARLERRLELEDYEQTRCFLEALADLSEETGCYPDISFGRTHVSLTIHAEEGAEGVTAEQRSLASRIEALTTKLPAAA